MTDHASLAGDWSLWRDFAVRSAGFPVSGLDVFGPGDEPARLRSVARDPAFQEAVTWQNPAALANAVLRVAGAERMKPSQARKREAVVASYWQRYCAKNDTIGFFGPLAWGRIADGGPALDVRAGPLVRERSVHLEAWCVQAIARSVDPEMTIASGPRAEDELRAALTAHADDGVRSRGLAALERIEAARDAVARAPRQGLSAALATLDRTFVELTGLPPVRNPGKAYGARTLSYVDCMRDVSVGVGPALLTAMAPALETLFEAGRWFCGRVNSIGRGVIDDALPAGGRGPFGPVLGRVVGTLMGPPPELGDVVGELHRRLETVLADPDTDTVGRRAVAAFADHEPAWRTAVYQSIDVQIAARDEAAVESGDYLAVVGDVHPGNNPLQQGVFADRHPDPAAFGRTLLADTGGGLVYLIPPYGPGMVVDARGLPPTYDEHVYIAALPDTRVRGGRKTWLPDELFVEGEHVVDRTGTLRVPLIDAFSLVIFIAGVRTFSLLPDEEHASRVTIGRTVLRRESWTIAAADVPTRPADVPSFAHDLGLPRCVFVKSPLERKPMYLDTESEVLARLLCRQARAATALPNGRLQLTEMLPGPHECWLRDPEGNRYVSELRLVGVDRRTPR